MAIFSTRRSRFERDVMQHMDSLYGTALRLSRNDATAQDLVQETLLKAFQHYKRLAPDSNLRAWLTRVLTNTYINQYRRRRVAHKAQVLHDPDFMNSRVTSSWANGHARRGDAKLLDRFLGEALHDAVEKLPEAYRDVVLLADVEEMAYKEIADALEIPIGTVMSRLHRGRRLLRVALADYVDTVSDQKVTEFTPKRAQGGDNGV
jgi:RNA polymerase sigma-70 factor (ECF subfamily)